MSEFQRRTFIKSAVVAGIAGPTITRSATLLAASDSEYKFEVTRTEAEWRSMFDEDTYLILREGRTEVPKTSKLWDDYREGEFQCPGCDLLLYTSKWRANITKGWVFFRQSQPNAILLDIGGIIPEGMADRRSEDSTLISCRRCGSHMGHLVVIRNELIHCINGRSLNFTPA